jgi:hypothetical protein
MYRVGLSVLKIAVIILGVLLTANTLTYLNFDSEYGFLKLKQEAIESGFYLPAYYSHVLVGGLILLVGFTQFNESWRRNWRRTHRYLGAFYVFGILFFAAPGGLVMSFFIGRGPAVLSSFILQCALWFYCTAVAFKKIKQGRIDEHEEWMYRSFALTLAAVTLRVYIFGASFFIDLTQPTAYAVFAWLSWLPNIMVAQLMILLKNRKKLRLMPE